MPSRIEALKPEASIRASPYLCQQVLRHCVAAMTFALHSAASCLLWKGFGRTSNLLRASAAANEASAASLLRLASTTASSIADEPHGPSAKWSS